MIGIDGNREFNTKYKPYRPKSHTDYDLKRELNTKKQLSCTCCGNDHLQTIYKTDDFDLLMCNSCSFVFKKLTNEEFLTGRLTGFQYFPTNDSIPKSSDFLKPALSWLPSKNLRIMDFGCGDSKIADLLRDNGHKVIALDNKPPEDPHPDRYHGNIEDFSFSPKSLDLIYSFKSFERIAEPKAILKRLFWYLNDNGLLLVYANMSAADTLSESDHDNLVIPERKCSFYSFKTFEVIMDQLKHEIVYRNPYMFIARK